MDLTQIYQLHITQLIIYLDENDFIRDWHGTLHNAFRCILENTDTLENEYLKIIFKMDETLTKLQIKAGTSQKSKLRLYNSNQIHRKIL